MRFQDFVDIFTFVDFCRTFATEDREASWYHLQQQEKIMASHTSDNWAHNPRWHLRLEGPSQVIVSLTQPTVRHITGHNTFPCAIGLRIIAETLAGGGTQMVSAMLPPHRIAQHANELQKRAQMKAEDSGACPCRATCLHTNRVRPAQTIVPPAHWHLGRDCCLPARQCHSVLHRHPWISRT